MPHDGQDLKTMNAPVDLAAERPEANKRMKTEAEGGAKVEVIGALEYSNGDLGREAYDRWKTIVPYVYDFFTNHHGQYASLSCRYVCRPQSVSLPVGFLASRFGSSAAGSLTLDLTRFLVFTSSCFVCVGNFGSKGGARS